MIPRKGLRPPEHIFPVDEWRMVEKSFHRRFLAQTETIFATANGYLGMRGNFEEGSPAMERGTYINGFYESWPLVYPEEAYGFAKTGQTMLNVTNSKIIRLYVDDEPFYLPTAQLVHYERALNMRSGTLDRELIWEMPSGKQVSIKSRRLVSFEHRHVAAISYEVTVLNAEAPVVISSELIHHDNTSSEYDGDPRRTRSFDEQVLNPKISYANEHRVMLSLITNSSHMTLACGVDHTIDTECPYSCECSCSDDSGKVVYSMSAQPGVPIRIVKYMAYHSSRSAPPEELCQRAERTLDRVAHQGFLNLLEGQQKYLDDFWRRSDVQIRGAPLMQQTLRWNLFQILQAAGRAEGAGIPAKGLTGHGYEGHYFWDTEIYVLPFLIYTSPRIARNLLKFRYSMLDKARERARLLNQKGVLFPWRTINGEEASAYYAAGTAQYHINADIMYGMRKYIDITGDQAFLFDGGGEMLVETARLWSDLGFFSKNAGNKFCIHGVTGPDEYNTVVNNNTFTNLMARENLWYAVTSIKALQQEQPEHYAALVHKTGLEASEIEAWQRAADNMYIPYDENTGTHPQDDNFLEREMWDFENTPADKYPLLLHYHPLVIYRHQVIKQADIVLAMLLLGHEFSPQQKKRNFDYYDPLTTGDSSLSACVQAIVAAELGYVEMAREYAWHAAFMDLADVGGNVKDGCHIASMGGTWMVIVYGLAGMRDHNGKVSFSPKLPKALDGVRFPLTIRGQQLEVDIDSKNESVTYLLREGSGLTISHKDEDIHLTEGSSVSKKLQPAKRKQAEAEPVT